MFITKFDSGYWVKLQVVPPYVLAELYLTSPPPPYPEVTLKGPAGEETAQALPGSPEMAEYHIKRDAYRKSERRRVNDFTLVYGMAGWFKDDSDAGPSPSEDDPRWTIEVPEGWERPTVMGLFGVPANDAPYARVADFIKHVLISSNNDQDVFDMRTGNMPIMREEAKAAAVPFDSNTPTANQ